MFLVSTLDKNPVSISFKTSDEDYLSFLEKEGCESAPYLGRYKWIHLDDISRFSKSELEELVSNSYSLIASNLSKKIQKELGLNLW